MNAVRERIEVEGGGWVTLRREEPKLAGKSPAELLELSQRLPGNSRYIARSESVELLEEIRSVCGSATSDESRRRLRRLLKPATPVESVSAEPLEAALEGSGFPWSRREQGWAIPAGATSTREITVHLEHDDVRLEAVLADWDALEDDSRTALAAFLLAAQATLRGVRFHLEESRAVASVRADAAHLDADVTHGLQAIANACRMLSREAAALLVPGVARGYLAFREIRDVPSR